MPANKKHGRDIVSDNNSKSMSMVELRKLDKEVIKEFNQKLWLEEIELEQRLRHLQGTYNVPDLDCSHRPTGLRRFDA
jgi:hypothetical protein